MEARHHRQFVLHDCLGRGGFGEVYRATMHSPGGLQTQVALKLLRIDIEPGGDAVSRLRDEGRLLAALRHPSILRAYDIALLDGRVGLVTEFVDGTDLHHLVGALDGRAALDVVEAVAEALNAAWSSAPHGGEEPLRLVHRDIKPSNIRLGKHGEVKLLDFGIARSDEVDREARTGTGSTVGSLSYMAPERFARAAPGPAADIYALGCTLFEVLVGRRFHEDPVPVEMFRLSATPAAHQAHTEEALAELPEHCASVRPLLEAMLAHDVDARPDAATVARQCDELAEAMPGRSLKRFSKDWDWPQADRIKGSFDGRTITEGTLDASFSGPIGNPIDSHTFALDLDEVEATAGSDAGIVVADISSSSFQLPTEAQQRSLALPVALVALLLSFGAMIVTWLMLWSSTDSGPSDVHQNQTTIRNTTTRPVPSEVPTSKPEPVSPTQAPTPPPALTTPAQPTTEPEPVTAPQPATAPKPATASEPTQVAPKPEAPVPAAPEPTPVATPEPAAVPKPEVQYGSMKVSNIGPMVLTVRGNGGTYTMRKGATSLRLAVGKYRMTLQAPGNDSVPIGSVTVEADEDVFVTCNPLSSSCSK